MIKYFNYHTIIIMNLYTILASKNLNTNKLEQLFKEKRYDIIYNNNKEVVNDLLFISSFNEFKDFINDQEELISEPFFLMLASYNKLCCSIALYEEDGGELLASYIKENSNIDITLSNSYEEEKYLIKDIQTINKLLVDKKKKYIALFDDTYFEGCYYVFKINTDLDDDNWESEYITRLI